MRGNIKGSCPFCDDYSMDERFDDTQELQEIMAEWEGHLMMAHSDDMVDFMVGKTNVCWGYEYDKRRIVQGWGAELVSGHPDEVECPFCSYVPPKKYEGLDRLPSPWEDTKIHIADEHWDEFLEWIDSQFLGIHEIAIEKIEEEFCEYDLEDGYDE